MRCLQCESDNRPEVRFCERCGTKLEQAREHLTTATMMYREMDMRFWLGPAEAELAEVRA